MKKNNGENCKHHFVYKTTNLVNGKFYIGRHSTNNLEDGYLGSGTHLRNSIKKHGKESFKREIIEYCSTVQELLRREEYWIKKLKAVEIGYNQTICSDGFVSGEKHPFYGKKFSEEELQKLRILFSGDKNPMYGRKHSQETRNLISEKVSGENNPCFGKKGEDCWNYGRKHTEESKRKIRENNPINKLRGEFHPNYGRKHTLESIEKIRLTSLNKTHSQKTKDLLRSQRLGKKFNEEHKEKISNAAKNRPNVECPWCHKIGSHNIMQYWHFDNCKENPKNDKEKIIKHRKESHSGFNKPSPIKGIKWISKQVKCPHCGKIGGQSNMKRYHFENCKLK